MKRAMPQLPKRYEREAKKKHLSCISRDEGKLLSDSFYGRLSQIGSDFGKLIAKEWTVRDATFSEKASNERSRRAGGGKAEIFCKEHDSCKSECGAYHLDLFDDLMNTDCLEMTAAAVNTNMKVRIVTSHVAACNYFRPLQKIMHNALRRLPVFEFCGAMPSEPHFFQAFFNDKAYFGNDFEIVSADYSSATDGINPKATLTLLHAILDEVKKPSDLSEEEWSIYKMRAGTTLTSGLIRYSRLSENFHKQNYGQMMGHLLSFPLLCLFNFAIFSEFCSQRKLFDDTQLRGVIQKGVDLEVRINGDDLIALLPRGSFEFFCKVVEDSGWELSIGKTYVHDSIGCINSSFFDFRKGVSIMNLKLSGLAFESADAFRDWIRRFQPPSFFFFLYRDKIRKHFGHPRPLFLFSGLPIEQQRQAYAHFGTPSMSDMLRSSSHLFDTQLIFDEEQTIEREFRRKFSDTLADPYAESFNKTLKFRDICQSVKRQCMILGKEGGKKNLSVLNEDPVVLTASSVLRRMREPEGPDADPAFWEYVGNWRNTRHKKDTYEEKRMLYKDFFYALEISAKIRARSSLPILGSGGVFHRAFRLEADIRHSFPRFL